MKLSMHSYTSANAWDFKLNPELDSDNTLLIIFGSSDLSLIETAFDDIRKAYKKAHYLGCSTAGEIYQDLLLEDSLCLAVIQFEKTLLKCVSSDLGTSTSVGEEISVGLSSDDLRLVMVLSDGLDVNGSELLDSLNNGLSENVVITGGLAGDGDKFNSTWVLSDGVPKRGCVTAIGFYGDDLGLGYGSKGGWDTLGTDREVTKSEGNILYELDGQPALDLYKKYLGDRAEGLPATGLLFPLAIKNEEESDGYTVRTILAIDEGSHSITFAGDLPQGASVRLMSANFDRLIDGAVDASTSIEHKSYVDGDCLNVAISCVGRKLVLGQRIEEEIEAALEGLPNNVKQIGFYSYGEISPLASGRCDLHNQTMTLTMLWEK